MIATRSAQAHMHVVLWGPPAVGKTTIGREVARLRSAAFVDLDAELEKQLGMPCAQAISAIGLGAFRAYERQLALQWIDALKETSMPHVLALGGGTLESAGLAEAFRTVASCVWLAAPVSVLVARGALTRGVATEASILETLLMQRNRHYQLAHVAIDADAQVQQTVGAITEALP